MKDGEDLKEASLADEEQALQVDKLRLETAVIRRDMKYGLAKLLFTGAGVAAVLVGLFVDRCNTIDQRQHSEANEEDRRRWVVASEHHKQRLVRMAEVISQIDRIYRKTQLTLERARGDTVLMRLVFDAVRRAADKVKTTDETLRNKLAQLSKLLQEKVKRLREGSTQFNDWSDAIALQKEWAIVASQLAPKITLYFERVSPKQWNTLASYADGALTSRFVGSDDNKQIGKFREHAQKLLSALHQELRGSRDQWLALTRHEFDLSRSLVFTLERARRRAYAVQPSATDSPRRPARPRPGRAPRR